MAGRKKLEASSVEASTDDTPVVENEPQGIYFTSPKKDVQFIHSGSPVLDCVLGGGWAVGRLSNIVGDKSTGKTLLAIEAAANFKQDYDEQIVYAEAEAAFDKGYAEALGMPVESIDFKETFLTVEDLFEDWETLLEDKETRNDKSPVLYIVDSLDALSDKAETERDINKGTYGQNKAKQLSEIFRRLNQRMGKVNITPMIISQVRANIGVTFGKKHTRNGGMALDFYASQVLWLSQLGALTKTIKGVERQVGVDIRAKCDKNKVGLPYRKCEFEIIFGFGVEGLRSCVNYLESVKRLDDAGIEDPKKYRARLAKADDEEYFSELERLSAIVPQVYESVENEFLPTRSKYSRK